MNKIFLIFFVCLASVAMGETICERIRARARCREIRVNHLRHEVTVRFTCEEDAIDFASDLKEFIR